MSRRLLELNAEAQHLRQSQPETDRDGDGDVDMASSEEGRRDQNPNADRENFPPSDSSVIDVQSSPSASQDDDKDRRKKQTQAGGAAAAAGPGGKGTKDKRVHAPFVGPDFQVPAENIPIAAPDRYAGGRVAGSRLKFDPAEMKRLNEGKEESETCNPLQTQEQKLRFIKEMCRVWLSKQQAGSDPPDEAVPFQPDFAMQLLAHTDYDAERTLERLRRNSITSLRCLLDLPRAPFLGTWGPDWKQGEFPVCPWKPSRVNCLLFRHTVLVHQAAEASAGGELEKGQGREREEEHRVLEAEEKENGSSSSVHSKLRQQPGGVLEKGTTEGGGDGEGMTNKRGRQELEGDSKCVHRHQKDQVQGASSSASSSSLQSSPQSAPRQSPRLKLVAEEQAQRQAEGAHQETGECVGNRGPMIDGERGKGEGGRGVKRDNHEDLKEGKEKRERREWLDIDVVTFVGVKEGRGEEGQMKKEEPIGLGGRLFPPLGSREKPCLEPVMVKPRDRSDSLSLLMTLLLSHQAAWAFESLEIYKHVDRDFEKKARKEGLLDLEEISKRVQCREYRSTGELMEDLRKLLEGFRSAFAEDSVFHQLSLQLHSAAEKAAKEDRQQDLK
uniref:Bromo domain-containing protein n=1 Tax=Chromera velia CCMP2878 TaxID=1169474 RepID=A0A0G4IDP5_9ALVE|eukprot:Cvel_13443.t1-p1 / transcript=Cvel_13443.t1 / gene=Cvel_13443 / organism=Chromera_velia_CCMP2878 / gene_product=hypothetical protein / transcript_product=hypothetical protein / location=Cvel_scaffold918:13467-20215(-) / protein_length=610 / sequence_SO=supercontig / SO=protein_coding / is_pseudo=false